MALTRLAVLSFAAGLTIAGSASAASITWQIQGVVRIVGFTGADPSALTARLASLGATVGAPVTVLMTFESSTPNLRPGPEAPDFDSGKFADAVTGASLSFPLGSLALAPDLNPSDPEDPSRSILTGTSTGTGEAVGSFLFAELDLVDPTGAIHFPLMGPELAAMDPTLFDPTALPIDPPSLALLDPFSPVAYPSFFGFGSDLFFGGFDDTGGFSLRAELTSLVRVPEPGAAALIALALLAVRYPRPR